MPTYEYECKSCGHTFDAFQSMNDEPLKVCPECGKEVRRLINGGTGIIFKGSGFYVTDKGKGSSVGASSKSSTKPVSSEKSEGASAEKSSGSGSDKAASPAAGNSGGTSTTDSKPAKTASK